MAGRNVRWARGGLLLLALVLALLLVAPRALRGLMLFKAGTDLSLKPEMARALPLIEDAHKDAGLPRGAVITSGREGQHSPGNLHVLGYAVDIRTNDLTPAQVTALARALRVRLNGAAELNRPYQVVVEGDHIHIEYQPYAGWRPV